MYALALRIWSLANPLMFLLLLPVFAAFMSTAAITAEAAAFVAAADAAHVSSPPNTSNATMTRQRRPIESVHYYDSTSERPPVQTSSRSDGFDIHDILNASHSAIFEPSTSSKRIIGRARRLRKRRHAAGIRHSLSDRWGAAEPQQYPTNQQQQRQLQFQQQRQQQSHPISTMNQHSSPDTGSTATVADHNWWRSSSSPVINVQTNESTSTGDRSSAALLPHATRHHHHQNFHMHKTLQPLQQQQQMQRYQPFAPPNSAITMRRSTAKPHPALNAAAATPTSPPSALSLPPVPVSASSSGAVDTHPATSSTSAPMSSLSSSASGTASAVEVRGTFSNSNLLRRSHHTHNYDHNPHFNGGTRRRYCSARDVTTLAFEAPTVFEGKVKSMSADRRHNFSVTFEVLATHKEQPQLVLPPLVRLQFEQRNSSGECDIYREHLRPRGFVRELEPGRVYLLFVEQQRGDIGNFSILGRPVRRTSKSLNETLTGVRASYGEWVVGFLLLL